MPRANAMVPPDAIRIEDEVWQEAFTRREPARPSRERKLRAIDRDPADWLVETTGNSLAEAGSWSVPSEPAREVPRPPASPSTLEAQESVTAAAEAPIAAQPMSPARPVGTGAPARPEAAPARRTVKIQGRGAERNLPLPDSSRRRPTRRPYERTGFRPDRVAMWAVMLGFLLVLVAIVSAHG
jgi:hypothetical protein